jgi:hypothetical protein
MINKVGNSTAAVRRELGQLQPYFKEGRARGIPAVFGAESARSLAWIKTVKFVLALGGYAKTTPIVLGIEDRLL